MRATSWLGVLGVLALCVGCTELNDTVLYHCESNADCGSGWECRPLGGAYVCVKSGSDQDWMNSDSLELDAANDGDAVHDGEVASDADAVSDVEADVAPSCSDNQQNGNETDLDCGGETECPRCGNQSDCLADTDCSSSLCDETVGVCVGASCENTVLDSAETDVDCGGSECAPCDVGAHCEEGSDCREGVCDSITDICSPASCTDGVANGVETDVDCGGGVCFVCGEGAACGDAEDCDSGVCIVSVCVCASGYVADGLGGCSEVDECALNTDNCDTNAVCTNTVGSFTCVCNGGYSGDGATCADLDECALSTDNCGTNAVCTNTSGSFTCACNTGYGGDGVTCTDLDECVLNTDNCDTNAICTNTVGSFTCVCNGGYSGDGATCADLDECALSTDNCGANAVCTNTSGSFTCACNTGYGGDGVTCTDLDECALSLDNCDTNAVCTNTVGGFTCVCRAAYSGDGVTCTNAYVTIPSGSFTMGSPVGELGRDAGEVQHKVTLTRSFEMKKTEVTQGEWQSLMGNNPSNFSSCGANCPVETVNWYEALAYANALSTAEGLNTCYTLTGCSGVAGTGMTCTGVSVTATGSDPYACTGYRLPTEAEWEYAYRATTTTAFYNGIITDTGTNDPNLELIGWYSGNASATTHPVGQLQANGWGLYDLSGNVWELTWDWHGAYPGDVSNPTGAAIGSSRVRRGGSWYFDAWNARAANRYNCDPSIRYFDLGFRLSRSLPAFVTIPSGSFTMGSPSSELGRGADELEHTVILTQSFEMKKTEVTQGEWQLLMGNNPSSFSSCGANCPVEQVNWYEALAYANALSRAEGLDTCYTLTDCVGTAGEGMTCTGVSVTATGSDPYACTGYRLPTESEWEYSYRAGTTSAFYNGGITSMAEDPNLEAIGWYYYNSSDTTHAVGQKQANDWGLLDLSGNVWEWNWDWYGAYPGTVSNPTGAATGSNRVQRGGSWGNGAQYARAADRNSYNPILRNYDLGFRLARSRLP